MQDAIEQSDHAGRDAKLTIVTHRPGGAELPWLQFLLGEWAGEIVEDPKRELVVPGSLIVTDRPDRLRSRLVRRIRRAGNIALFHVGDEAYRSRLDAYGAFAFVWRTHLHTALDGLAVRQLPIGPRGFPTVSASPSDAARRPPAERLFTWSFTGTRSTSRDHMLAALAAVDGGTVRITPYEPGDLPLPARSANGAIATPAGRGDATRGEVPLGADPDQVQADGGRGRGRRGRGAAAAASRGEVGPSESDPAQGWSGSGEVGHDQGRRGPGQGGQDQSRRGSGQVGHDQGQARLGEGGSGAGGPGQGRHGSGQGGQDQGRAGLSQGGPSQSHGGPGQGGPGQGQGGSGEGGPGHGQPGRGGSGQSHGAPGEGGQDQGRLGQGGRAVGGAGVEGRRGSGRAGAGAGQGRGGGHSDGGSDDGAGGEGGSEGWGSDEPDFNVLFSGEAPPQAVAQSQSPRPGNFDEVTTAAFDALAESVFAPCGMGTAHLESSRIYAALELGAIPIVERRRWLDYFGLLLGDHPLPSVRSWDEAPALMSALLADQHRLGRLQARVVEWWAATKARLAAEAQEDVEQLLVGLRTPYVFGPLDKPAPRWRNRLESMRQQDMPTLRERVRPRGKTQR